jgi:hypothetical protein
MVQSPPAWDVFFTSARSYNFLFQYGRIHIPTPEKLVLKVAEALRRGRAWLFLHPDVRKGCGRWYEQQDIDCYRLSQLPLLDEAEGPGSRRLEFAGAEHYLLRPRFPEPHVMVPSIFPPVRLEFPEKRWERIYILNPVHTLEELVGYPQRKVS